MATESKVTAEQQAQNNCIVDQYRELQRHLCEKHAHGQGMASRTFCWHGHAFILHVSSGIIPHFTNTNQGPYLTHLRKLLKDDWFLYSVPFKRALTCLKDKGEGKNLLPHDNSHCGLDVVGKQLFVNVLMYKVPLHKLNVAMQRVVSFFHKVAEEVDLVLTTVVITCTAIVYEKFHILSITTELRQCATTPTYSIPTPWIIHDFKRQLLSWEEDHHDL